MQLEQNFETDHNCFSLVSFQLILYSVTRRCVTLTYCPNREATVSRLADMEAMEKIRVCTLDGDS